jgi:rubredoxin
VTTNNSSPNAGVVLTDAPRPVSLNCPQCGAGKDKRKTSMPMGATKPIAYCGCGYVFEEASRG